MHAATLRAFGGPEVITWSEVPDPSVGPGEVLVDVAASAVNRADILQRMGHYPPPPGAPEILGLECSGRVAALGASVTGWVLGQEVCALLSGGGYAERVAVPAGQLLPVPRGLSLVEAAALPEVICTVWSNVFLTAALEPGEVFLVHGGSGGVGTMAIQLAHQHRARVFCTAGAADKRERCRALGAEVAIDYRTEDFVEVVRQRTDGRGADVILDILGGTYLARNVAALAPDGRLVLIGMQAGRRGELDISTLMGKRAWITASTLRGRSLADKAEIVAAVRRQVWPLIEDGRVRPVVGRVLPLREAGAAHRAVEAGEQVGKVVLTR